MSVVHRRVLFRVLDMRLRFRYRSGIFVGNKQNEYLVYTRSVCDCFLRYIQLLREYDAGVYRQISYAYYQMRNVW